MATEKELTERETASRAESIARGLANSPGFVLRLRAQYLDAVRAHDVADTTESFLAMCAAGASLTSDERDAAVTTRCEANVVFELATDLMLATAPDSAVGVYAHAAYLAAIEAEWLCACAAHPRPKAAPEDARDLHQRRYAELRAAKAARVEAHGGECFGVCCLGQPKAAR